MSVEVLEGELPVIAARPPAVAKPRPQARDLLQPVAARTRQPDLASVTCASRTARPTMAGLVRNEPGTALSWAVGKGFWLWSGTGDLGWLVESTK
jgi:hypothetical protein